MTRKTEGEQLPHCRFFMWEVGGGCLSEKEFPCPACKGEKTEGPGRQSYCSTCGGSGVFEKPEPGKLCHQARPDCLAYEQTTRFSCGGGGD